MKRRWIGALVALLMAGCSSNDDTKGIIASEAVTDTVTAGQTDATEETTATDETTATEETTATDETSTSTGEAATNGATTDGGEPLPTAEAAEAIRGEIEASRVDDVSFREGVFCSPKEASRELAAAGASVIGLPDTREVLENFASAGQGELEGNLYSFCAWDFDDPINGITTYGVASGPINGPIEEYLVDILTFEGTRPDLTVVALDPAHGGRVTWSCEAPSDDWTPVCEMDWTDDTFVVSLYVFGDGARQVDAERLRAGFIVGIPDFVNAAAALG